MSELTKAPAPPPFQYEAELQQWLAANPDELESGLWLVGYEFPLGENRVDLLGVDQSGQLVVIEVKRANATREAVGQVLDYVSALELMEPAEIAESINQAESRPELAPVADFEREYRKRYGRELANLMPVRALLACTSESAETGRILEYLQGHNVDARSCLFTGYTEKSKRAYRRKPAKRAQYEGMGRASKQHEADSGDALGPRGPCQSEFPGSDALERSKIRSVHQRASEHIGGDLFRIIHCAIVGAFPDAHELAREEYDGIGRHRRLCCGIAFTAKATAKDPERRGNPVEYVTVRLYPENWPGKVRIQLFGRAVRHAGDHANLLDGFPEFDPEGGRNRGHVDGCEFWFTEETWPYHQANFEAVLRAIQEGWKAEREADRG